MNLHQERGAHAASPPTEDRTAFHGGRLLRQMRQVGRTCKRNHMEIETKTTPDLLVRNEGTVFVFCHSRHGQRNGSTSMFNQMPGGSATLSWLSAGTLGD